MRIPDLVIAAVLGALSISIILTASSFPRLAGLSVGPGLFPIVLAGALMLCSALLALEAFAGKPALKPSGEGEVEPVEAHPAARRRFFAVIVACAIFAGLGQTLGFVIVGILALALLMLAFGVSSPRALTISIIAVVLLDLFFVHVMRIPLPLGVLAPLGGWL
jgi:putative tricarboxylic transport membrane protein